MAGTQKWFDSKSEAHLVWLDNVLTDAQFRGLAGPALDITNAIVSFFRNRRTDDARRFLARFPKRMRDSVWHLNIAFLDAYDGNLSAAAQHYRKAVELGVPQTDVDVTVGQVEHWLLWQLEIEPERVELYFCLGFVNLNLKGDRIQARKDFQTFLDRCPPGKYAMEKELIVKWIPSIATN